MNQKTKCKKCGLEIGSDLSYCPYCGTPQVEETKDDSTQQVNESAPSNESKERSIKFFSFESKAADINIFKSIAFFVIGLLGLNLLAYIFSAIAKSLDNRYFLISINSSAAINFALYLLLLGIVLIVANKDLVKCFAAFKKSKTWIQGLAFGFLLMIVSAALNSVIQLIFPTGQNNNETGLDSITDVYPLLSLFIFGLVGPFVEEITYRIGLFGTIKKRNKIAAYLGTALVFGLIHFDFGASNLAVEFANLPSYVISGLLLCYFYDYGGFEVSFLAHATNNFVAVGIQILFHLVAIK